jgi:hypothetical protein
MTALTVRLTAAVATVVPRVRLVALPVPSGVRVLHAVSGLRPVALFSAVLGMVEVPSVRCHPPQLFGVVVFGVDVHIVFTRA